MWILYVVIGSVYLLNQIKYCSRDKVCLDGPYIAVRPFFAVNVPTVTDGRLPNLQNNLQMLYFHAKISPIQYCNTLQSYLSRIS